ncbi:DUF4386 domain-containing protein [Tumidithrix helvetica PCC 7403]|uniref:hypothetical protein n=1 Tax=Tumidithrix helvetica TaxID=3457545 RepID=UPI003C875759
MNKTVHKVGFWSGLIAFASTVAFVIVQMLQLFDILSYPLDEVLIYGFSLCIVVPFLLEMLALHYIAPTEKKFWSHAALIFTVLYVAFVTANYIVQLATVIPMTLQGTSDEILILRQTPHSLFWDFDAIGYIFMGFATLFAVPIFEKQGFQRWVRYSFLAHSLVTPLIVFVYFYPNFSEKLLLIGMPWAITAPLSMLLLAIMFKKDSEVITQTNEI